MENHIRRLLSWLWLFQAAALAMLGYIPRLSGIECYCYNEPNDGFPECYWEGEKCTGDVCYVHRQLLNGVFYTYWDCLRRAEHHVDLICKNGSFNVDTQAYACCEDGDFCNQNLEIVLPVELPQPVSTTDAVTSAPFVATTVEESGSGSGNSPIDPSSITTERPDLVPESTSTSTPVSSHPTSRSTPTPTTLRTLLTTQAISRPSTTTEPQGASLQCFCSTCPTRQNSCGPNSKCYVSKDFKPRQDVSGGAAIGSPESYSWGCFSESEAATKCRETDKYSCCSDEDLCNEHLKPPPLRCFCSLGTCPNGETHVSCGVSATCYVSSPSDSSSADASPDSLVRGCFDQSEARVKCNDTQRYNCCSDKDYCNEHLDPPTGRSEECTSSASGGCQTKQQQNFISIPVVASVTVVITLVVLVISALIFVVLLVQIRRLKQPKPVKSSSTSSDSSENSVTTESESLPSPTSASSPHHHYLHITADDPVFGDSLNKCNGSKV